MTNEEHDAVSSVLRAARQFEYVLDVEEEAQVGKISAPYVRVQHPDSGKMVAVIGCAGGEPQVGYCLERYLPSVTAIVRVARLR